MPAKKYLSPVAAERKRSRALWASDIPNAAPITLHRAGRGKYSVLYGLELTESGGYHETARVLGYCTLHALLSAGKLD